MCEKLLAQDVKLAEDDLRFVESSGLVAATALNRRFDRQYSALRSALCSGEIDLGEPFCFTSRTNKPPTVDFTRISRDRLLKRAVTFLILQGGLLTQSRFPIYDGGCFG